MSQWQRDSEVVTTEWVVFTKDLAKGQTAFLEEVTRDPSRPANWRLSLREQGFVTVEQWSFKLNVTEHKSLRQVTEKADELLASYGKEPELPNGGGPFVDPLLDVKKLRNRQLETQRVVTRA